MCIIGESESGHGGIFQPCPRFVTLQSDRDRLAGVVQGMEEQNARNFEVLRRAEAEVVRLETTLKRQAKAMKNYQSAEAKIASINLENARKLAAECDPKNVESEKQMNAILTEENQGLEAGVSRLQEENERLYAGLLPLQDKVADSMEKALMAQAENARLREALEFYAKDAEIAALNKTIDTFAPLIKAVDALLNLDWENSVMLHCPEASDCVGIMARLQDARDGIDGRRFYAGATKEVGNG